MEATYTSGKDGGKTMLVTNKITNNTDLNEWETIRNSEIYLVLT